jgi:cobalt-zinc-cadmium efflux system protein
MHAHHHHHHHHNHAHHHGVHDYDRAFALGIALNLVFVVVEGGAGFIANSLALLADAGHNLSDVLGLLVAWGATYLARRRPTSRRTYGLGRSSVLAALVNAIVLLIAMGAIAWEAVSRLGTPTEVQGPIMIGVAAVGVVLNTATAALFARGRKGDLNIRGAFLHMAADAAVSAGVVLAGLMIGWTHWRWLDPAMSLVIVGVIAIGTWGLLRDSINLALDAVPAGIDRDAVETYLRGLPGVTETHDLHIWALSTTETALTVHLIRPEMPANDAFLTGTADELRHRFGIGHATLQIETGEHVCELASAHAV